MREMVLNMVVARYLSSASIRDSPNIYTTSKTSFLLFVARLSDFPFFYFPLFFIVFHCFSLFLLKMMLKLSELLFRFLP